MADSDDDLQSRIEVFVDDDAWRCPTGWIDRRHFCRHQVVEYMSSFKGLSFAELMAEQTTANGCRVEMLDGCSSPDPPATREGRTAEASTRRVSSTFDVQ
jgi:hypothetical protein